MPDRRPTLRDVAREARVSTATVSYVMNGIDRVSPKVEARVRAAAGRVGYAPNAAARALRTGRTRTLGCLLPSLVSPVFPQIARAVQQAAQRHGYATFVVDTGDDPEETALALTRLANHGVEGAVAVLHPRCPTPSMLPFPLVSIDAPREGLDSVAADHRAGGRLLGQLAGARPVGLLTGAPDVFSTTERRAGILEGLGPEARPVWEEEVALSSELPAGATAALASGGARLVLCVNDLVAIAALGALRRLGPPLSGNVAVAGFDDMEQAAWPLIDLTTVRQPLDRLGQEAVALLMARVADPMLPPRNVRLPVELIRRGSA